MKLPLHMTKKPSGQVWLGDIPEHWAVRRLKFQVNKVGSGITPSGGAESYEREGIPLLRSQNVHFDGLQLDDVVFISPETHDSMANSKVRPNDVLLNITGASIGRCCVVPAELGEANVNQHVAIVRSDSSIESRFLAYLLSADPGQEQIVLSQTGSGREGLTFEAIRNFSVPLPSLHEQQQIAAFLDWKTEQIDALIARKHELLEKLKEKRLAVITEAVTRGLNPAAPLCDSGIPWLGQVPQHWTLNYKLGFISASEKNSFVNGPFGSDLLTSELVEEGVPVLYSGDVKATKFLRKSAKYVTAEKAQELDFCRADAGDLLLAKVGDPPGDACVYPIGSPPAVVTQDVIRIRVDRDRADPEYLSLLLVSEMGRHLVRLVSVEATRGRFSLADLKNVRFPLPPMAEQEQIARTVAKVLKGIDEMNEVNETAIDRLTEYRIALVTAATTGKIDVRNVRIPQPVT